MKEFILKFYSADKIIFEGKCISVIVPLEDGFMEILADHSNMIGEILSGELTVKTFSNIYHFAVYEGMVKVEAGEVLILVDSAENSNEIDENRAKHALEEAQKALKLKQSAVKHRQIEADLIRALNRLNVKKRSK